jgi:hypothetical protein
MIKLKRNFKIFLFLINNFKINAKTANIRRMKKEWPAMEIKKYIHE